MKTIGAIIYDKNIFGISLLNNIYTVIPYCIDDYSCSTTISYINSYNIKYLLIPIDTEPYKIKILRKQNITLIEVSRKSFKLKLFKNTFVLGNKAFNSLCIYHKHEDLIISNSKNTIGSINGIPIMICDNMNYMLLKENDLFNFGILNLNGSINKSLNYTYTKIGEERLKKWLNTPLINIEKIKERQHDIKFINKYENVIHLAFNKLKIPVINNNNIDDLTILTIFLEKSLLLSKFVIDDFELRNQNEYENLYKKLTEIKFLSENNFYSNEYSEMLNIYKNLPHILNKVARIISNRLQVKLAVIYIPQVGFVIESKDLDEISKMIKEKDCIEEIKNVNSKHNKNNKHDKNKKHNKQSASVYLIDGFDYNNKKKKNKKKIFNNNNNNNNEEEEILLQSFSLKSKLIYKFLFKLKNNFYYKTEETEDLDLSIGDIYNKLKFKELEIYEKYEDDVNKVDLMPLFDFVSEIDVLSSISKYNNYNNCNLPFLYYPEDEKIYCEKNNKKKLKSHNEKIFNDYKIKFDSNFELKFGRNTIITTGTNFISEFGQLHILAQVGFSLPCLSATLPIFEAFLFTGHFHKKGDLNNSTFVKEMEELGRILAVHTSKSLILMDFKYESTSKLESIALFLTMHDFILKSHTMTVSSLNLLQIKKVLFQRNKEILPFSVFKSYKIIKEEEIMKE